MVVILGGVAQLVERYIVDVDVAGSNPVSSDKGYIKKSILMLYFLGARLVFYF